MPFNELKTTHKIGRSIPKVKKLALKRSATNQHQDKIVSAFLHAWSAYKKYAWGRDELRPLSKIGSDWMGVGLTIVDSLDTLYIMGLDKEYQLARDWVVQNLTANQSQSVQLFEITIRLLGGLLSAYHLSGDEKLLDKAIEFGEALIVCFGDDQKLPAHRVVVQDKFPQFGQTNLAEVGSLQLEFRDLSRSSGDQKYEDAAWSVSTYLHTLPKFDGLAPSLFDGIDSTFSRYAPVTIGAMGDSFYEYLLKQWLQTGKTIDWLKEDFIDSYNGTKKHLLRKSVYGGLTYIGFLSSIDHKDYFQRSMDHLSCFYPGTLALAYIHDFPKEMLETAAEIMETCYSMYSRTPTKLAPESVNFLDEDEMRLSGKKDDFVAELGQSYNIHRPETVESLYYMYKATKDPKYRRWGWEIFEAFENVTKLDEGYAGVNNVYEKNRKDVGYKDKMETFYLAETLKYLYLLFSDDEKLIPLDEWVFNTEAHPLPIYTN